MLNPSRKTDRLGTLSPVPLSEAVSTADVRAVPVDRTHPLHHEPMVEVRDHALAGDPWYFRQDGNNPPYGRRLPGSIGDLLLRRSVVARLRAADDLLRNFDAALLVVDAWRPIALQQALFDHFTAQIGAARPDLSPADLLHQVRAYVSDPSGFDPGDATTWPTHITGAAVDVLLIDRVSGTPIDLGAGFDDMGAVAHSDHFERLLQQGQVVPDDPRLLHRRLLHHAMRSAGFANYPMEFWHFDWGNQMYVANLARAGAGAPDAAWYGWAERAGRRAK